MKDIDQMTAPIEGLPGEPPYLLLLGEDCEQCAMEGVKYHHQESGAFLYFDAEEFLYIFECENDPSNHDQRIEGRWDGEEAKHLHYQKASVIRWTKKQYARREQLKAGCEQKTKAAPKQTPSQLYLTPAEVAHWLGVSVVTLSRWRTKGVGPSYIKVGLTRRSPVRYDPKDVDAWLRRDKTCLTGGREDKWEE